jgi:SAM-dependent methyltransferase
MQILRFNCPECSIPLTRSASSLRCTACHAKYHNHLGVSCFIEEKKLDIISRKTSDNWGFQWTKAQYDAADDKNYFLSEEAFSHFIPLQKEEYKDKRVLVLGCGNGKEIHHILRYGAKLVVGVDISPSVFNVRKKFKGDNRVALVRADITNLPFGEGQFDIIIADHVVQHLHDWEKAMSSAIRLLTKKGILAFNVYSREGNQFMITFMEPIKKSVLGRLPLAVVYWISFMVSAPSYLLIMIRNRIGKIGSRLPMHDQFRHWESYGYKFFWKATVFDLMHAPLTEYISMGQLKRFILANKLSDASIGSINGTLWRLRGTRTV